MRLDDTWGKEALDIIKDIDANILITSLNKRYNYDECRQFDLIASCTTGTDHIDNHEIPLIKLEGEFLRDVWATAEHTWGLILSLVRKVPWAFDDVKQGNWERERWQGTELRGKTLGVIGLGRVGRQVAKFAEAFGMRIEKADLFNPRDEYAEYKALKELLHSSDIVTVHVPLNEETKGMFGHDEFRLMKPTAYFINTSRGAVVNEDALIEALEEKYIAGAALDVVTNEIGWSRFGNNLLLQADNLDEPDNLIITPHLGGQTTESRQKTQIFIAHKIKEYLGGHNEKPRHV